MAILKLFDTISDLLARFRYKVPYFSGRRLDPKGNQSWYFRVKLHRDNDLPARIDKNGTLEWWTYDKRDRPNGEPAVISSLGTKEWWVDGERHRDGGLPAVEKYDGTKEYYVHGKLHRDDGPAIERPDGKNEWYRDGQVWAEGCAKAPEIRAQKIEKAVEQATVVDETVKVMTPLKFKRPTPGM
jgi:hypothetical protein